VIIAGFLLMTAPVVSMVIMRAAVYRDLRARKHAVDGGRRLHNPRQRATPCPRAKNLPAT
jgi:multisubunit Na+/H+ antiporter MnhG subunit